MAKHIARMHKGASAIGYGLVVGLISVVALGAITQVGQQGEALFSGVGGTLDDVVTENVSFPSPSASASASASASPVGDNVYWNCPDSPNYLVFVANTDNQVINSFASVVSSCAHYGFKAAGTSNSNGVSNLGWGTTDNTDMLQATHCYNCHWSDQGNPWYYQNGASSPNCSHVSGTAPMDLILAGAIVNSSRSSVNCATFKQEVNGSTALTPNSDDSNHPLYWAEYNNNQDEPNCSRNNQSHGGVIYNGTPDYILCASATNP